MAKYFMSTLIYFHEPEASENKACSEIFSPTTLDECNKLFIPH